MGVEATPEPQAAAGTAAVDAAAAATLTPELAPEFLAAPSGWQKKLAAKKGGTPKRRDVVFVAPCGEEIKSKAQLERYLKKNPGGPPLTDFNWSTGETPRRSERLSTKTKESPNSAEADPPKKRSKKKTPLNDSKEEEEPDVAPAEKETPAKDQEGVEGTVAKLFETNEGENVVNEHSEEADAVEVVKAVDAMDIEATDAKQPEEPELVTVVKEVVSIEVKEVVTIVEPVQNLKEAENNEMDETKEQAPVEAIKQDVDAEMLDATAVTQDMEGATAVKEEVKVTEEVTTIEKEEVVNGDVGLQQSIEVEAVEEVVTKETIQSVESSEDKKDSVVDGDQDTANGAFSADEPQREEEHVDTVLNGSEHEKPEINAYFGATKPQEAHPAEVGVSS